MKTGICTKSINCETEDALSRVGEQGAEICGIDLRTFYEYRPEFAKKYAERLDGVGVNSVSVAPHNFEAQLFAENRRVRGDGFYWLDQVLRSAQLFGAKYYILHGAPQNADYDKIAERVREISEFCQRYGVTLCLENDPSGLCCRPWIFKELKERCQSVAAVFNLAKAKKSCYPYQMYLTEMGAHLAEVRLDGGADCEEVVADLKKLGYLGAVLVETEGQDAAQIIGQIKNII
ncbi:MAG: sugar phosphate isomerase/epimerase [Clostridia bacterium]|nr:sugar phosphate isomerase/epimerase [Clostridia bacterium]